MQAGIHLNPSISQKKEKTSHNHKLGESHHTAPWWQVMCLTGVDYFSTLGYQPGIAFLAAGVLSPVATAIVVLLTFIGALPVYWVVAKESPNGQGSIAMLERLWPGWRGKTFVLTLLGFAATDFVITMTLSAADATAHLIENPIYHSFAFLPRDPVVVTTVLLFCLASIFYMGFKEAIGVSVLLVVAYLGLTSAISVAAIRDLMAHPHLLTAWHGKLTALYPDPTRMALAAALVFPKLALGLSGFETGVSVMPLVEGERVKNTRKLLLSAACIMGIFLLVSSLTTAVLIPQADFAPGGAANGRAISYLAHRYFGHDLGTIYDISTVAILWFAGASAMAGLLTLVPRYLPRYGMAPQWASATRPLVIFFAIVSIGVTVLFRANVDAQAAAYATGVLVLMTSASTAVTLTVWSRKGMRVAFSLITLILGYTTLANIIERPDGLFIASFFIGAILSISLISRCCRALELRIRAVSLDPMAQSFIAEADPNHPIALVAHRPGGSSYSKKLGELETNHNFKLLPKNIIFLEVTPENPSEFADDDLAVTGKQVDGCRIFACQSPAVPNAIAALLLDIEKRSGRAPHAYFGWTEGSPIAYIFKYIFWGEGETAPLTREILRNSQKDVKRRPIVHVG